MVVSTFENLEHLITIADGFVPEYLSVVDLRNKIHCEQKPEYDNYFLREITKNTFGLYQARVGERIKEHYRSDIFLVEPVNNESVYTQYLPIQEELPKSRADSKSYRMLIAISDAEEPEFSDAFIQALKNSSFETRPEDTYKDNERFRAYLEGLTEMIIAPYASPSLAVIACLQQHGLGGISESV